MECVLLAQLYRISIPHATPLLLPHPLVTSPVSSLKISGKNWSPLVQDIPFTSFFPSSSWYPKRWPDFSCSKFYTLLVYTVGILLRKITAYEISHIDGLVNWQTLRFYSKFYGSFIQYTWSEHKEAFCKNLRMLISRWEWMVSAENRYCWGGDRDKRRRGGIEQG